MRFLIPTLLILVSSLSTIADDDTELRHFLSLLSGARIGNDYEAIKKLVPKIEPLRPDAGEDNTEALIKAKARKVALRGEFNFSKGHLVSHGFASGELTHGEAHEFLLRCITILEQLYGPSERQIILPTESDGPGDAIGMSFKWRKNKTHFGLDFEYRRKFAVVSWGAQAE
jgi:hypothetical protein